MSTDLKFTRRPRKTYSLGEEVAHGITHGLGFWLSTIGMTVLMVLSIMHGEFWRILSVTIYGTTLVTLFLASTLYHSVPGTKIKRVLRTIDHCSIYLLIAGSYTPFTLVTLHGTWGWNLFWLVWFLTICGVIFKIFFAGKYEVTSTLLYLAMGWMAVFSVRELYINLPIGGLLWIIAGGLFYTFGVIFFHSERIRYNHAIWHLFVLAGAICHYFAVLLYVVPLPKIGT